MTLLEQIQQYWNQRSKGYSKVNQKELNGDSLQRWKEMLSGYLPQEKDIQLLDIGTGPGFFPIVLSELGYQNVTAVDYSENMLAEAQQNFVKYGHSQTMVEWKKMDAQQLRFADEIFEVIVTRNLTWNLENPQEAYREWLRVLKPGGKLLVFDANWYVYLSDEAVEQVLLSNRQQALKEQLEDFWQGEGVDEVWMEKIVRQLPLTSQLRPQWDIDYLQQYYGVSVSCDEQFGEKVWNYEERLNYAASPMFALCVQKESRDGNKAKNY